ncbi:hypothetical protein SLEP1_g35188 [Rubroshorea leprosula]|uniref:Uncharacterized protein n=1 Tax=Rubroshorea leprosula TaxID=152421 RepID=A0AAV5KMG6_9ROSI|nr:hypothetical protein SLEP1_g35188 [Rubroshorea leprosula]
MTEVFPLLHFLIVVFRFIVFGKYGTVEHFLHKLVGDRSTQLNLKLKAGGMLLLSVQCCFPFIITKLTMQGHLGCLISMTIFYAFQHFSNQILLDLDLFILFRCLFSNSWKYMEIENNLVPVSPLL